MPVSSHTTSPDSSPRQKIGDLLRETRKGFGGQIDQIATTLRIRPAYLTAIEESHYDRLPAQVYALGFVRAYANYLGLDADEAVRRFKQETADFEPQRGLSFPMPLAERSVPGGTMLLAALILAFCGYGLWYYVTTGERARPERVTAVPPDLKPIPAPAPAPAENAASTPGATDATPAAASAPLSSPSAATTLGASDAAAPSPAAPAAAEQPAPAPVTTVVLPSAPAQAVPPSATSAPAAPAVAPVAAATSTSAAPAASAPSATPATVPASTPTAAAPAESSSTAAAALLTPHVFGAGPGEPSHILLQAKKDCWIQVRDIDNHIIAERTLHVGDSYRVPDRAGLILRTGNGSGLDIEIDGKQAPALGGTVHHNVALDPGRLMAGTAISEN